MIEPLVESDASLYALVEDFFRNTFTTDNPLITEAIKRMLAAGGKRLRPRITLLAAKANGSDPEKHLDLAAYMELIHVATLIHDDVVDNALTRRGVNATAVDYGNRISVLAGDYLFAWIFKNVTAQYPHPVPNILSATLADICDGEVLQLRALGNLNLAVASYVEIVMKKTASLFAASAECGAIMGGAPGRQIKALRDYGLYYGIAFQMNDDLLDLTADASAIGKPVGNDLQERKVTIPLILALARAGGEFRGTVERFYDGSDDGSAAAIIEGIELHGGFAGTREQIAKYAQRAKLSLAPLEKSGAKAELTRLADALLE
ncbi:MAG TPA: polyprenyl synthetase family protein [Candidatus Baltobacteraceae bacterium]|jgi:geranylgeranyl pyrophosphate synthase|nr:polyprenyl synthetase family protein [Candidatus Baltobacteraceae bacterium]